MAVGLQFKRNALKNIIFVGLFGLVLVWPGMSWATIISRTITIDGNMSDWTTGTGGDILTNPGQFSTDAQGVCPNSQDRDAWSGGDIGVGSCVGLSGGTGRDLKGFAFTYDQNNLYLYVSRYASSTNITDWWFYIDVNNDGKMGTGDILYEVAWHGSNQTTDRYLWTYTPANPAGDPMTHLVNAGFQTADGYTMPGTISNRQVLPSAQGGAANGLEMETYIPWSVICGPGCGPQSVSFHISSSNGTNLPSNIVDNMSGPSGGGNGGGAFVITDLAVSMNASASSVVGGSGKPLTYDVTVNNQPPSGGGPGGNATGVSLQIQLPADVSAPTVTPPSGETTTYNASTHTLTWNIGTLDINTGTTLVISVTPNTVTTNTTTTATASNLYLNESDSNSADNSASANVVIRPSPDLTLTKTHTGNFTVNQPGQWTIVVSNSGAAGTGENVGPLTVTDKLDPNLTYQSGTGSGSPNYWSCSASGQTVTCTYSQNLPAGSSTQPLLLNVLVGPNATSFVNTASVASAHYESDTSNNTASDAVTVLTGSGALECYATANDTSNNLNLFKVNTGTFGTVSNVPLSNTGVTQIAYDCATGTLYGVSGNQFGSIDPSTGTFAPIGSGLTGVTTVSGLAYDATTGAMYGVENKGGGAEMFQINMGNGTMVDDAFGPDVPTLAISAKAAADFSLDSVTGQMSLIDGGNQLDSVNRTNGSVSSTYNLPASNMIGLSSDNGGTGGTVAATSANRIYLLNNTGAATGSGTIGSISAIHGLDCIYGCSAKLLDIAVTQTASASTIATNSNVTFTITVTNKGPSNATALQLKDIVPAPLTFTSYTASTGIYDSTTGLWHIGPLASGASVTLYIVASSSSTTTPASSPATSTASLQYVTQTDTNTSNNTAIANVNVANSNLTTSTKTVQDRNGGQPNPGDVLRYTITLKETAGVQATGVSVTDTQPPNTSNLTLISMPAGATDNSGTTYPLEIDNITVPANGTVSIVFDVTINAAAPSGAVISNTATLNNPTGLPTSGSLTAPDVTVVKSAQVKQLYLGPAAGETVNSITYPGYALGRLPFTSTTGVTIAGAGGSQEWMLSPPLVSHLTIDGSTNPGGVSVPIQLVLSRGNQGNHRKAKAKLGYDPTCSGNPANITLIGKTAGTTVLSGTTGPVASTLSFNLSSDTTVPAGACMTLEIVNKSKRYSHSFDVIPAGAGTTSQVDLQVFTFINVNSIAFYASPGGTGTPLTQLQSGNNVYIRSTVSDPFGNYDITHVSLNFEDPAGNTFYSANPMTQVSSTAGTKTYQEGPIAIASNASPGVWYAYVTADEGTEGLVQDQALAPLTVIAPPNLSVTTTANPTKAVSGDLVTYTMVVTNNGPGAATNVSLNVLVNPFSSLNVSYGGASPFKFADDPTTPSNLTIGNVTYNFTNGATALASSGFDANVTGWTMKMNGTMSKNGKFTITYQMKLR